ncbi:MAG: hypothetical protein LBI90_03590 [Treponema sp.]|nr:hypothetical protein [Treponema sp.]
MATAVGRAEGGHSETVVFGINKITERLEQINSEVYRGTYNYADEQYRNALKLGAHYTYDMSPFDKKYPNILFAKVINDIYSSANKRIINSTYGRGLYVK